MGQVVVRQLDDVVIEAHRRKAKARGVSLEQELRDVLTGAATSGRGDLRAAPGRSAGNDLGHLRPAHEPDGRGAVREDRDSR